MVSSTLRCAIYTRQSTTDDGRVLSSCEAQLSICLDFINAHAGSWEWTGERFDDVGVSGATTDRPALQRLLERVHGHAIDKVVVYRLDRLTRSMRDSLDILDAMRQAGVELLIVTAPELGSAATDRFLLNMMGAFAEFERDMIRSRLVDTRETLKRHGRRLAGLVPFGYDAAPSTRQLIANESEALQIRYIFELAASGKTARQISEEVNARGWRTKLRVAKRSGRIRGGNAWTPRQILDTLANPVYIGCFADGKAIRPGRHQPIVSRKLFDQARAQVESRRTTRGARRTTSIPWPLRGKVVCPNCGRIMSTHVIHHKPVVYRYYRCRSHAGGQPPCKMSRIAAFDIETAVEHILEDNSLCQDLPSLPDQQGVNLQRFQEVWALAGPIARRRLLPQIVERVIWREETSEIQLSLNVEALERLAQGSSPGTR